MAWTETIRTDSRRLTARGTWAEYQPWVWISCVLLSPKASHELSAAGQFLLTTGKQSGSILVKHFVNYGELFSCHREVAFCSCPSYQQVCVI